MRYVSFRRPDGTPSFGRLDGETIVELATDATLSLKAALTDGSLATLPDGASFAAAGYCNFFWISLTVIRPLRM